MARLKPRPQRGEVYWVALDPVVGSEIRKTRPAVIVSNNSCNAYGLRVVVVPLTSHVEACYPGETFVRVKGKEARVLGDQIRSVDKARLKEKLGSLSQEEMERIDEALRITLAL